VHVAQKFEHLLELYRRPDGSRWSGQEIDEATDGIVTRSYVTNLRKGRIENPGLEKMRTMGKVMGFPPEMWFADDFALNKSVTPATGSRVAARLEYLFDAIRNPAPGEPYTNAEVARMTLGDLSAEEVEGIRTGVIGNPTAGQVVALADVFGVDPSYLLDRGESPLDRELVEALRDETVREIWRLPERERRLVLEIVRQFGAP
jgi:transcriptional regulator with XRE-family HTH domain